MTQYPINPPPVSSAAPPPAMSVMAIISLVLGVLGFCSAGLLGLVGLILGIVALTKINRSGGRLQGGGLAIAGISVGALTVLMCPFWIGLLLPALAKARQNAMSLKVETQLMGLAQASSVYQIDQGQYPPADNWVNVLVNGNYISFELVEWPGREDEGRAFAMNAHLDGKGLNDVRDPARTVLFFEVAPGGPLSGGAESLTNNPRSDRNVYLFAFVDGHIERLRRDDLSKLRWDP